MYDSLIIRYDASRGGTQQPMHRDGALLSVNIALGGEYTGGGTRFEASGAVLQNAPGHAMIHASWQPLGLPLDVAPTALAPPALGLPAGRPAAAVSWLSASAQRSEDGTVLVLRVVNTLQTPVTPGGNASIGVNISLGRRCASCNATAMSGALADANPSWEPNRISPRPTPCSTADGRAWLPLAPSTYTILQFNGCE